MIQQPNDFLLYFGAFALVIILLYGIYGWFKGIIGLLWGLLSLAVGVYVGYWGFVNVDTLLARFFDHPTLFVAISFSAVVGLAGFLLCRLLGNLLFVGFIQRSATVQKYGKGPLGALLSLIPSCFLIWVILIGFRLCGTIAEMHYLDKWMVAADKGEAPPSASLLVRTHSAFAQSKMGEMVDKIDPVTPTAKRKLAKMLVVARRENIRSRLSWNQILQENVDDEKFKGVLQNEKIQQIIENANYWMLLVNPDIIKASEDEVIEKELEKIDLEKSLDEALTEEPEKSYSLSVIRDKTT